MSQKIVNVKSNSNDFTTGMSFNLTNGTLTLTIPNQTNPSIDLDGRYFITSVNDTDDITEGVSNLFFTNELAQDAVGNILGTTDTIDLTYNDGTPSITADALYQMSITSDVNGLKFVGDLSSPGNTKYYGTDGSGTKGWFSNTNYTYSLQVLAGAGNDADIQLLGSGGGSSTLVTISGGSGILITEDTGTDVITVAHSDTSSQNSINGSGRTYIQDVTLDTYGHVTGLSTATETVTNTNDFISALSFATGTGILTATVNNQTNPTIDLDGRYAEVINTPVNNQIGVWTGSHQIEGDASFRFDTTNDYLYLGNGTAAPYFIMDGASGINRIQFKNAGVDSVSITASASSLALIGITNSLNIGSSNTQFKKAITAVDGTTGFYIAVTGSATSPQYATKGNTNTGLGIDASTSAVALRNSNRASVNTTLAGIVTNVELFGNSSLFGATTSGAGVLRINDVTTTPSGTMTSGGLLYVSGTDIYFMDDAGTHTILNSGSGGGGVVEILTTTGTSGAATLIGDTLNIPIYANDNTWRPVTAGGNSLGSLSETLAFVAGTNVTITESGGAVTINSTGGSGTVTSVTAGTGMTQTGTSTINPTLNVIAASGAAGTALGGLTSIAGGIHIDYEQTTTNNVIMSASSVESPSPDDSMIYYDETAERVSKCTIGSMPFTNNIGDITNVSAGNGLTGGGANNSVTVTMGTPTTLTPDTTNSTTATSHKHEITGFQLESTTFQKSATSTPTVTLNSSDLSSISGIGMVQMKIQANVKYHASNTWPSSGDFRVKFTCGSTIRDVLIAPVSGVGGGLTWSCQANVLTKSGQGYTSVSIYVYEAQSGAGVSCANVQIDLEAVPI